jgi:hypothetical protein
LVQIKVEKKLNFVPPTFQKNQPIEITSVMEQNEYETHSGKLAQKVTTLLKSLGYNEEISQITLKKITRGNMVPIFNFLLNHVHTEE